MVVRVARRAPKIDVVVEQVNDLRPIVAVAHATGIQIQ